MEKLAEFLSTTDGQIKIVLFVAIATFLAWVVAIYWDNNKQLSKIRELIEKFSKEDISEPRK
jgi:hypothetical protein